MILVYKFDFVFIQNIKISLIDLPRERYYKPEGRDFLHTSVYLNTWGTGNQWCSASTHKLGQGTSHIKKE